ncbi:tail terminator [Gordonia phage Sapo]|nr:tail terminator [Gordonia phage Sapo]
MADVVKDVTDALVDALEPYGYTVADAVPAELPVSALPVLVFTEQPGSEGHRPWNQLTGPVTEWASLDFDLFDTDLLRLKATARLVSRVLYSLVRGQNSVVSVHAGATFAKRPDWNDRVLRVGGEFDFEFRP